MDEGPAPARLAVCSVLYNLACIDWRTLPADATLRSDAWMLQALSLFSHAITAVPSLLQPAEEEALNRLLLALYVMVGGRDSDSGPAPGAVDAAKELQIPQSLKALAIPAGSKLST